MMDPDASGQDSSTPLLLSWQDDNQVRISCQVIVRQAHKVVNFLGGFKTEYGTSPHL